MEWEPSDVDWILRRGVTLIARFLVGQCYLGAFPIPGDPLKNVSCLLCGGEFFVKHLLWHCIVARERRKEFLSRGLEVGRGKI